MAALTQQEWFDKLSTWVPKWYFEDETYQVAVMQALAKLLASADTEMRAQFDETFISRAADEMVDQHGYERSISRYSGESDANYAGRIQNLAINLDPVSLATLATAFLVTGTATVYEHDIDGIYGDRDSFLDRREIMSDINYCAFSVVVPYQGVGSPGLTALEAVANAVNAAKALGTLYHLVELST